MVCAVPDLYVQILERRTYMRLKFEASPNIYTRILRAFRVFIRSSMIQYIKSVMFLIVLIIHIV